jgi:ATP-binding cassette subfamily C protein
MRPGLRLLRRCGPPRRALGRVAICATFEAAPAALSGLTVAHAVDAFRLQHTGVAAAWLGLLAVSIGVGAVACQVLYATLAPVVEDIRDELLGAVSDGALREMATTGHAGQSTVTQLVEQVDRVRTLMSIVLRNARSTVAPILAVTMGLCLLDVRLALAVVIPVVAALGLYALLLPRVATRYRDVNIAGERFGADCTSTLEGLPALRGLGAEDWARGRLADGAEQIADAELRTARTEALRHLVIALGTSAPVICVLLVAAPLLARHELSTGALVGACTYVLTVLTPAMTTIVTGTGARLLHLLVTLDRLAVVADSVEPPPARVYRTGGGDAILVASGLTFTYRDGARPVISDLDLRLGRGELLAVVGASGSGKSTFALLVAGLLAPTGGAVTVAANARVCLVPQEAYVFIGTLRENLAYLAPTTRDANLEACVDAVGLRRLADRIGGLDATVDPESLSPDARQRFVIGRAYLARADLLVLDEATCHLDAPSECAVEGLLRSSGSTLVVVAHRLDVTARADQVLYFDGRDATAGGHAQLLASTPSYRELLSYGQAR